ncbi:tRNA adenosine(34) deaminase TadA [Ottowia caeni]|uniref:tRNA adenosine(34) deaminase TadA n=1 Tax=Ottowia caeni TaxID=2870339 RepID=UPI001E54A7B3|nr:tRNA adenosine(34) deaminase TadA [Ottowia caeni]
MNISQSPLQDDEYWMGQALDAARAAGARGEVPVGAVVVHRGQLIATGGNAPIEDQDPTAHAEIAALRAAARKLGNYRLDDCELYVTLEPCPMCAGAMLHARLKRVVFGARDPRTGAAGSVVDLFGQPMLNHQTQLAGGVLANECGALLKDFFRSRRGNPNPLREDALRTREADFANLPDYHWDPRYVSDLPSLAGLRLHYVEEGASEGAARTWLCLHGNPTWSYLYRHMIPVFAGAGDRVVAPDMPGFGKSDKPKRESAHSFSWHRQVLLELIERLDLRNIVLVVHDWGAHLGLTLPMAAPGRFTGLLVMNTMLDIAEPGRTSNSHPKRSRKPRFEFDIAGMIARGAPQLSAAECAAYQAPFPDKGHCSAIRAVTQMMSEPDYDLGACRTWSAESENGTQRGQFLQDSQAHSPAMGQEDCEKWTAAAHLQPAISNSNRLLAKDLHAVRQFWRHQWRGQSLMAIGARDSARTVSAMQSLRRDIFGCPEPWVFDQAGHHVPEHGRVIAEIAITHFSRG